MDGARDKTEAGSTEEVPSTVLVTEEAAVNTAEEVSPGRALNFAEGEIKHLHIKV